MRFVTIADTHIRNTKYHEEYRIVFQQMYDKIRELEPDYIIHLGDICHSKTNISPEYCDMTEDFLRNLSALSKRLYIILGNHDVAMNNMGRMDSITPIVRALKIPSIELLKYSQQIELPNNFSLNVFSILDKENWLQPKDMNNVNICLFHGSMKGVEVSNGWILSDGEDLSIFDNYDYVFLGDIHRSNYRLDLKGKIRYIGNTVQGGFGEEDDKGFLVWDIEDKENFNVQHIILPNPKPFVDIVLNEGGNIPEMDVKPNSRIRVLSKEYLSYGDVKKTIDLARVKFSPDSIIYDDSRSRKMVLSEAGLKSLKDELAPADYRNSGVQENLIRVYFEEMKISEEKIQNILKLNKKYVISNDKEGEIGRNISWELVSVEWDNLFNYGEKNKIDFGGLNGVVGLFGKSFSGKTAVVDTILFVIYNSISKSVRKNFDIINENKTWASGKVKVKINNMLYTIERQCDKYEKRLKGEISEEAKTTLNFYFTYIPTGEKVSLNGDSRTETDKNIRNVFGTLEDFLLTNVSSQFGAMTYISEGSTKRKEILAKFMDLEVFGKKFEMAKEDALTWKVLLKKLEGRNFDEEIEIAEQKIKNNKAILSVKESKRGEQREGVQAIKEKITLINSSIEKFNVEEITIGEEEKKLKQIKDIIESKNKEIETKGSGIEEKKKTIKKMEKLFSTVNIEQFLMRQKEIESKKNKIDKLLNVIKQAEIQYKNNTKKTELLKEVPCGNEFKSCKFIRDAFEATQKVEESESQIEDFREQMNSIEQELEKLDPDKTNKDIRRYEEVKTNYAGLLKEISSYELLLERGKNIILQKEKEQLEVEKRIEQYYQNEEEIKKIEELTEKKKVLKAKLKELEILLSENENSILLLHKEIGSLEQIINDLNDKRVELNNCREEYECYELYLKAMHTSGIAFDIIRRKLPFLNSEISKVLVNMIKFEVFFENDENKLEVLIRHPKFNARPIETCSGAEKTIASLAIRLALLKITSLPTADIFMMDEPFVSLDKELLDNFASLVHILKENFKTTLIISHLDELKDSVDMHINIGKDEQGYAHIEI